MKKIFAFFGIFVFSLNAADFSVHNEKQEIVPQQFAIAQNQQLAVFAGSIIAYRVDSEMRYKNFLHKENASKLLWAFLDQQKHSQIQEPVFYFYPFTHKATTQIQFGQEELVKKALQIRSATQSEKQAIKEILQQDDHSETINSSLWTQEVADRVKTALEDAKTVDELMFGAATFKQKKPVYVGLWFRMQEYWYWLYYNYLRRG